MIDPKPDNQPAFPQQTQMMSFRQKPDGTTESEPVGHPVMRGGLSMRDYFAAHAPITLEEARAVHAHRMDVSFEQVFLTWSQMRFAYADAMLRARAA